MTALLLANIGNRDIWVDKDAPIPGKVNPAWKTDASRRALGEALLSDWEASGPYVALSIVGKALAYAREQVGQIDGIILVSSDQAGIGGVDAYYVDQDTCELAPVVERLLVERHAVDAASVRHWTVRGNPADYGGMQAFFRDHLGRLREASPQTTVFLEVSGGTPAMTSMLLTVGAAVFGVDARAVYVSERDDTPFELDLGRRAVAESLLETVRLNLRIYAYHATASTVRENRDLLASFVSVDALAAVLDYARQRINFNFDLARQALAPPRPGLRAESTKELAGALRDADAVWLLAETYHNAEIKLRTGAYGDFLTRVFRFDEAALRHAALTLGARLVDEHGNADADGEFLEPAWLAGTPDLLAYLTSKNVRGCAERQVSANRFVLTLAITFMARQQGDPKPRQLLKRLGTLDTLSQVRNKSFAVHTFEGVSRQRMAQAFIGPDAQGTDAEVAQILDAMRAAFELAAGRPIDDRNPYDEINALCLELIG